MKKTLTSLILLLILNFSLYANDGAYYVSGNQLIPIGETDISVQKEVLTIKRKNKNQVEVSVSYEFYNPGETKSIIVGFEASSPSGDADPMPNKGKHPNIYDFNIQMNHVILPHKVAMVDINESSYYRSGEFITISPEEIVEETGYIPDFYYVYYFTAKFKKGRNFINHTYTCNLSASVDYSYTFDYILTAANRWANKQIDDFTLIVDMGEFQDFYIDNTAFGDSPKWVLEGKGVIENDVKYTDFRYDPEKKSIRTGFCIRKGKIIYQANNFTPRDELRIYAYRWVAFMPSPFDYRVSSLSWALVEDCDYKIETVDEVSNKILRNLPFARHGYIFNTPEIQEFYSTQKWYTPDANYKGEMRSLSIDEQIWVKRYSE